MSTQTFKRGDFVFVYSIVENAWLHAEVCGVSKAGHYSVLTYFRTFSDALQQITVPHSHIRSLEEHAAVTLAM